MLHIYPAKFWQDKVLVVGTPDALEDLRNAIDSALKNPGEGFQTDMITTDDTPYAVAVTCVSTDHQRAQFQDLPAHYDEGELDETQVQNILDFVSQYAD